MAKSKTKRGFLKILPDIAKIYRNSLLKLMGMRTLSQNWWVSWKPLPCNNCATEFVNCCSCSYVFVFHHFHWHFFRHIVCLDMCGGTLLCYQTQLTPPYFKLILLTIFSKTGNTWSFAQRIWIFWLFWLKISYAFFFHHFHWYLPATLSI